MRESRNTLPLSSPEGVGAPPANSAPRGVMKGLAALLMLVALPASVQAQSWTDHVIANQYGPPFNTIKPETTGGLNPFRAHDALADGMPTYWNWSRGAVKMQWNSIPAPTTEVRVTPILTGRFGDAAPDTHGKNYRTHVRNYELWYYSASQKKWVLLDAAKAWGAHYTKAEFAKTGSITAINESDGSVSFPAKAENWTHFYTASWPYKIPSEKFLYLHARGQFKLSGPDARTAKVLGNVGIDYKSVGPDGKSVNGYIVPAALQVSMRYVGTEYQWFTATTMLPDEIRAYPPPAPATWSGGTVVEPAPAAPPPPPPPPVTE